MVGPHPDEYLLAGQIEVVVPGLGAAVEFGRGGTTQWKIW